MAAKDKEKKKIDAYNEDVLDAEYIDDEDDDDDVDELGEEDSDIKRPEDMTEEEKKQDNDLAQVLIGMKKLSNSGQEDSYEFSKLTSQLYTKISELIYWRISKKYVGYIVASRQRNQEDISQEMFSEAWIEIMKDYKRFNPKLGSASGFLVPVIDNGIQKGIYNATGITQHYSQNIIKLEKARKELEEKGEPIDLISLHIKTGISFHTLKRCFEIIQRRDNTISYEEHASSQNDTQESYNPYGNVFVSPESSEDWDKKIAISAAFSRLKGSDGLTAHEIQTALREYFENGVSITNLSQKWGVTTSVMAKIVKKGQETLVSALTSMGYGPKRNRDAKKVPELNDNNMLRKDFIKKQIGAQKLQDEDIDDESSDIKNSNLVIF